MDKNWGREILAKFPANFRNVKCPANFRSANLACPVKPGKIRNFQKWQNVNKTNKFQKEFREA